MTVLLDLRGQELEARACGGCSGSSSDNKIRARLEDLTPSPLASGDLSATGDVAGERL